MVSGYSPGRRGLLVPAPARETVPRRPPIAAEEVLDFRGGLLGAVASVDDQAADSDDRRVEVTRPGVGRGRTLLFGYTLRGPNTLVLLGFEVSGQTPRLHGREHDGRTVPRALRRKGSGLGTRTREQQGEQEEGTSRWQDFEKLAEKILTELQPLAEVKWNDHIYGHLSTGNRQIDVSIRWASGDDKYLTIVQAKDQRDPADIKVVDEFLSVIRDVQATGGILICWKGFSKRAEAYARNCGISLFNMHDAQSLTWSQQLKVPIIWTELTANAAVKWDFSSLEPGDTMPKNHPRGPDFTVDRISRIDPIAAFERHWNGLTAQRGLGASGPPTF